MQIEIRMAGRDADQLLASLYEWFREDPDIRRYARVSLMTAEPEPDEMGATFEVIQLIVDSGFQVLNLALAYANWRGTQRGNPHVTIDRDGTRVSLTDADPDVVEKIVRALS
jgi:membrane-associated two-gene conflict system component 1 (EACC1)